MKGLVGVSTAPKKPGSAVAVVTAGDAFCAVDGFAGCDGTGHACCCGLCLPWFLLWPEEAVEDIAFKELRCAKGGQLANAIPRLRTGVAYERVGVVGSHVASGEAAAAVVGGGVSQR